MLSKVRAELINRPYRVADALGVNAVTVHRWVAYLMGGKYGGYQARRPQKRLRAALARVCGVSESELNAEFEQRNSDE